ncbi:chitobiase/beta-hexosaminidase C-terminal domain-containing protein [Metabacillus bambusae]|uniref:Chitobiase/beta-hexosaminidase C-terminal domain-containing protein n=1 Tax=Metabacillus bambusae TaxID=2795218 RepID=A0ABS3N266_9BACI|nr:chitobiase/beta-hexosaminidase C-terminal domain-containing protein [Metabacillus bambusae]MBO1512372.1 chitobiase/beta-hexosaminidase C-terminal domain-containing protein [Metabacillus bambusae]
MVLVIMDYFEGTSTITKTYQDDMMGFKITNDHNSTDLTFTIHGITISVKPKETFNGKFTPFRSVTINTSVPYRAIVSAPFYGTDPDTTPPEEVTDLSASNVTPISLTLSWTASPSSDIAEYNIYQDGTFLASINSTNMKVTDLTPFTEYTFRVVARDIAGNESSGTNINVTTAAEDTTPPALTITSGGTFTDIQTVTMTTEETATIYYTIDGTDPTTSSPVYSSPLTLTETTTLKAFAKDTVGNESTIQTVTYTKIVLISDGLILHYDFTNKAESTSNTITDTVNNVEATLIGVSNDSATDGYVDNKGLLLQVQDYVQIPTNTSPLNQLIDLNSGLTIQMISYDTNGSHWKTEDGKFTSAKSDSFTKYRKTDGSEGNRGIGSYWFVDSTGYRQSYQEWVNPIGSNAINIFTLRINVNNTASIFINDAINENGRIPVPQDFVSYINSMAVSPLQLRRNFVGHNTAPETLVAFVIYNRELTDNEVRNNYHFYQNKESLEGISVNPTNVQLKAGESQRLSVQGLPNRYTELLSITFQSGNEGFVTVDNNGLLTGISDGETNVSVTATYEGQTFTEYVNVKIGGQVVSPPSSTRNIIGMSINRKTNSLNAGESFVVMATALSSNLLYDIFHDNIVLWESSDPSVAKVQYGVVEGVSPGTTTLTAYDGTGTYSESFDITVVSNVETPLTEAEIYYVDVNDYSIKLDNTDSSNTTNGIQNVLDHAAVNGYKKIIFPKGTYLISPAVRTIYPPTDMIIDFSDSILNIEPSILTVTGYKMFYFTNVKNTKLIRTHVYGERDSTSIQDSVEGCISVLIDDCMNTGFESCTFSKSPGFNVITGTLTNRNMGRTTQSISVSRFDFEAGNLDENGNIDNSKTSNYYRYNQYMDVSGLGEYYLLGYTQGYHGYPYLRSRLYSIHFYDQNYLHIESQMYNLQYYNYPKPPNAKYAKIVIYQEAPPSSGDNDFNGAVAFIRTMGMPRNCYIKNCTFEDNFSTGLAMCGGQNWLIEGNTFSNNGGRMPGCDIDWEDGWEHMVGDILKNNTFNSRLGVIFSAGGSLAAINNTFNRSTITVWSRTQNYRVFNNIFNGKGSLANDFKTQGDSVLARNIFTNTASYSTGILHTGAYYKVHDIFNNIV